MQSCAARVLLCAITSVGFCTFSMMHAIVKVFPDPVTPNSVWCFRRWSAIPDASFDTARGWSPFGLNSCRIWNSPVVGLVIVSVMKLIVKV